MDSLVLTNDSRLAGRILLYSLYVYTYFYLCLYLQLYILNSQLSKLLVTSSISNR
jgi:hypothetical protein